ncbi:N-acetylmuramoyl-L-alanine amidase [Pectinatus frisingensis]|uniref:N-acetylmuramoyl-L-alanine amidase n=1 Tax=Pectinatus frisingensis TaxID=865 RepID=UPI003D8032BC
MNIVEHDWAWPNPDGFETRQSTLYFIVHHTDGPQNQDTNEIFAEHVKNGWNGIGYHFVIKGDEKGTIVRGRPLESIGAHALGLNYCSIGIALEGDFESSESSEVPTDAQIASLKGLLKELYTEYPNAKIIGHRDVADIVEDAGDSTACPGDTLYNMLPDIIKQVQA